MSLMVATLIAGRARPAPASGIAAAVADGAARMRGTAVGSPPTRRATWCSTIASPPAADDDRAPGDRRPRRSMSWCSRRRQRRKRLLVADMESTIIENEMLDELAEFLGLRAQVAEDHPPGDERRDRLRRGARRARRAAQGHAGCGARRGRGTHPADAGRHALVATMRAAGARPRWSPAASRSLPSGRAPSSASIASSPTSSTSPTAASPARCAADRHPRHQARDADPALVAATVCRWPRRSRSATAPTICRCSPQPGSASPFTPSRRSPPPRAARIDHADLTGAALRAGLPQGGVRRRRSAMLIGHADRSSRQLASSSRSAVLALSPDRGAARQSADRLGARPAAGSICARLSWRRRPWR